MRSRWHGTDEHASEEAALTAVVGSASTPGVQETPGCLVWVGTTNGTIRVFELSPTGKLSLVADKKGPSPLSFLAFHPKNPVAYGAVGKRVQVYRVNEGVPTPGKARRAGVRGTHVEVDPSGRFVFLASYGGNAVMAFPLDEVGVPVKASLELCAPQELCRKAHQVRVHPGGVYAYAQCLGDDTLQILRIDGDHVRRSGRIGVPPGSGPRHLGFHPSGERLFVLTEFTSTIFSYSIDTGSGNLTKVETISALPDGRTEGSRSSDIHVSRDGRFVYAVHREPLDEIVTLQLSDDGRLRVVGRTGTGGQHSRCFVLSNDGKFVVLAHSNTRNVVVRRIDPKTGIVGELVDDQTVGAPAVFVGLVPAAWPA